MKKCSSFPEAHTQEAKTAHVQRKGLLGAEEKFFHISCDHWDCKYFFLSTACGEHMCWLNPGA